MKWAGNTGRQLFFRHSTVLLTVLVSVIAIGGVAAVAFQIFASSERADARMATVIHVKQDLDVLQALHVDANTDFLKGLGTSRWASYAWPVARVGEATRCYDDLEKLFAGTPDALATVHTMREATARWAQQLDELTAGAVSARGTAVSSSTLLAANETFSVIAVAVARLRAQEDARARADASYAAQRLAMERTALAITAVLASGLLAYGFTANYRISLARSRARIIADEAEKRFREYFEKHPVAMLIFDVRSLTILAANGAAQRQYACGPDALSGMRVTALFPAAQRVSFREKIKRFHSGVDDSGASDTCIHMRRDLSVITVQMSYHCLQYGGHDACFITAIDVTEREQAKQMLETVINSVPNRICWKDRDLRYVGGNRPFAADAGLTEVEQVAGLSDFDMPWKELSAQIRNLDARVMRTREPLMSQEESYRMQDGSVHWLCLTKVPLFDAQRHVTGVLTCYEDITSQKGAELALRLRSRALEASVNAVLITRVTATGHDVIEYANPAFGRITGYAPEDILGHDSAFLLARDRSQPGFDQLGHELAAQREVSILLHSARADGSLFWNQLYIAPVRDESGAITHHISVLNDVTELVESRDRLHMQARSDALTSLPNRAVLREWIERAVRHAPPGETAFAVLFMDIDHFKDVNDTLGHRAGDGLLQHVGRELRTCVGADDLVVRYGGDEFVLAVAKPETDGRLKYVLSLIHACLKEPVSLENVLVHVQMSLGIACFPDDGRDVETLLRHADLAMYRAKASGPNAIQRFDLSFAQAAQVRTTLSRRMRVALEDGGFNLVYQPQVDIQLNRVTGVEALIRWHDAELGQVNPASFIPVAEENGLIGPIGQWVLEQACVQARSWQQEMPGLRMSVNVSPLQIARGDFQQVVRRALAGAGLPPRLLELEITESVLVAPGATEVLNHLRELGVGIAIDDFGAGYSSLSYLRTFHADRLKIDMSFVRGISHNREDEAIITAILAMGRSLGLSVVAEGVETATQLAFLVDLGCDFVQGYYFAKPMPARQAMTYMAGFKAPLAGSTETAAEVDEEPVAGFEVNRSGTRPGSG